MHCAVFGISTSPTFRPGHGQWFESLRLGALLETKRRAGRLSPYRRVRTRSQNSTASAGSILQLQFESGSNQMPSTSARGGAIWWTPAKQKVLFAWCNLQVKLCDPCPSALCVLTWRYTNSVGYILSLCAVLRDRLRVCVVCCHCDLSMA